MRTALLTLSIAMVILIGGCVQTDIIECGSDKKCFLDAQELCKKAKFATTEIQKTFGEITTTVKTYAEIKSGDPGNCILYLRYDKFEISDIEKVREMFSGTELVDAEDVLNTFNSFNGAEMTCTVPNKVELTMDSLTEISDSCQGTMKTAFEELAGYYESLLGGLRTSLSKEFQVVTSRCAGGIVTMFIQNIGTEEIGKDEITIEIDGEDASSGLESDIEVYRTVKFSWDCGGTCSPGEHNIFLKTVSEEKNIKTMCS